MPRSVRASEEGKGRAVPLPASRLLTLPEAAAYCRLSAPAFERACPVTPLSLSPDERLDKRLLRYDRKALDRWLDGLSGLTDDVADSTDWGAKVFG
ncbi:hypothetical protein MKK88_07385 [Methylobacterium sp. E-005]|uniref:hypothetical protein n=1 Tax=Methylobacterium sp. E-005 TaxID=2836549 RepID=UPI001FBA0B76|nr:hypothetical protein [Methylobacterium sp. E-005]MCJ2085814.1 hypothetical protein [Methylobacterium sp. E-005]